MTGQHVVTLLFFRVVDVTGVFAGYMFSDASYLKYQQFTMYACEGTAYSLCVD